MKSRFSALDVRAVVLELQALIPPGSRVQNIYDYDSPTAGKHALALKIQTSSLRTPNNKLFLVIDPGIRVHASTLPVSGIGKSSAHLSSLAVKLRKEIKGRRLMLIEQCGGWDRVVHLEFGYFAKDEEESIKKEADSGSEQDDDGGEKEKEITMSIVKSLHIYVELYAQGNVILTDSQHRVLMLSRPIEDKLTVGSIYEPPSESLEFSLPSIDQVKSVFKMTKLKDQKNALRALYPLIPNSLLDDALRRQCSADFVWLQSQQIMDRLLALTLADLKPFEIVGVTFEPLPLHSFLNLPICPDSSEPDKNKVVWYDKFNECVDAFFRRQDQTTMMTFEQRLEQQAQTKLQAIHQEQQDRLLGLETARLLHIQHAQLLDANVPIVEAACQVVQLARQAGSTWRDIEDLVHEEQQQGRPLALMMRRFDWPRQIVYLLLEDQKGRDQGKTEKRNGEVPVVFKEGVHANINRLYEQAKWFTEKEERTREALNQAFKSAKQKIYTDLKKQSSRGTRMMPFQKRQTLWFQKFAWFMSSDKLLVLAGRDAQQNELLVKRYLQPNDIYVHADLTGAASVVIKISDKYAAAMEDSNPPSPPIRTLHEAAQYAEILSRAWDAKVVCASWWVYGSQVSKSAPSGEYLPTGSFMIRGKKNLMPPMPLHAGFGFMFISDRNLDIEGDTNSTEGDEKMRQMQDEEEELLRITAKYSLLNVGTAEKEKDLVELVESGSTPLVSSQKPARGKTIREEKMKALTPPPSLAKDTTESVVKRGQRGKLKKIKPKYKDQDEEERQLRMKLLGHTLEDTKKDEATSKKLDLSEHKITLPTSSIVGASSSTTSGGNVGESKDATIEEISILNRMTGDPFSVSPNALVATKWIQAVPIFGPWLAVKHFSSVVKLTPSVTPTGGKGKLCKQIVMLLSSNLRAKGDMMKLGKEGGVDGEDLGLLIKAIPDTELQLTFMVAKANVLLTQENGESNLHQISTKKKKDKRKKKK